MIYIVNLTFAEENSNFEAVEQWLKEVGLPIAANSESGVTDAKLLKIIDVPGDPEFLKEGGNISLQLDFEHIETAKEWLADYLEPLTEGYMTTFNRQPLWFATILEHIRTSTSGNN